MLLNRNADKEADAADDAVDVSAAGNRMLLYDEEHDHQPCPAWYTDDSNAAMDCNSMVAESTVDPWCIDTSGMEFPDMPRECSLLAVADLKLGTPSCIRSTGVELLFFFMVVPGAVVVVAVVVVDAATLLS